MTRAQLAALINRSFQLEESKAISYSDVKADAWYYDDVTKAAAKGYENGTFKPNANVSRQELASRVKIAALQSLLHALANL